MCSLAVGHVAGFGGVLVVADVLRVAVAEPAIPTRAPVPHVACPRVAQRYDSRLLLPARPIRHVHVTGFRRAIVESCRDHLLGFEANIKSLPDNRKTDRDTTLASGVLPESTGAHGSRMDPLCPRQYRRALHTRESDCHVEQ